MLAEYQHSPEMQGQQVMKLPIPRPQTSTTDLEVLPAPADPLFQQGVSAQSKNCVAEVLIS